MVMSKRAKIGVFISWFVALLVLVVALVIYFSHKPASVTFLDVGQGDACVIQDGNGTNILIDGGDEGEGQNILRYLRVRNIRSLDAVVVSHCHEDHVTGILEILESGFPVSVLYLPPMDTFDKDTSELQKRLNAYIETHAVPVYRMEAGSTYTLGEMKFEVLWPQKRAEYYEVNNRSLVMRLFVGENSFLFTGDAELAALSVLCVTAGESLDVDVLKVPHHGGDDGLYEKFYDLTSPKAAVISVGVDNVYRHPSNQVIDALTARNIKVYRTDRDGAVSFVMNKEKILRVEKAQKWRDGL